MTENTGFEAYKLYTSLKLHFTSDSYDAIKYSYKTNVSKQSFTVRKDKYQFYKLSRKYELEELKNFYIANFIQGNADWVGDLIQNGDDNYTKWKKTQESLTYTFENDVTYLFDTYAPGEMFKIVGNYPNLLKELMQGKIHIETLLYMNMIMGFLPNWKKQIQEDIVWPEWELKLRKYQPFIFDQYKIQKFQDILREKIRENV